MWTDMNENQRPLTTDDILIVSPYNAHVALLATRLPKGARGAQVRSESDNSPIIRIDRLGGALHENARAA
jgi:uncharacterized protein